MRWPDQESGQWRNRWYYDRVAEPGNAPYGNYAPGSDAERIDDLVRERQRRARCRRQADPWVLCQRGSGARVP